MMRIDRSRLVAVVLCVLSLCALEPHSTALATLPHDAYVWQRRWTPTVERALFDSMPYVRQWRVLAAEVSGSGEFVELAAARDTLILSRKPIVLVVRINGQIPRWSHETIAHRSISLLTEWQGIGVPVIGLEIDHDCGTARLNAYSQFLTHFQEVRNRGLTVSITALPAWLSSKRLTAVLNQVDEAILQVHSVTRPSEGLFDRHRAHEWIRGWARSSSVPFRVALPTYGSRVTWKSTTIVGAVESEVPRFSGLSAGTELFVRPLDVSALIDDLRRESLPLLAGFVWFRLPTDGDQRAWTLATWHHVMLGRPRKPQIRARITDSEIPGTSSIYVVNEGQMDEVFPPVLRFAGAEDCESADALPPYAISKETDGPIRFRLMNPRLLRAGKEVLVGWFRCSTAGRRVYADFG